MFRLIGVSQSAPKCRCSISRRIEDSIKKYRYKFRVDARIRMVHRERNAGTELSCCTCLIEVDARKMKLPRSGQRIKLESKFGIPLGLILCLLRELEKSRS